MNSVPIKRRTLLASSLLWGAGIPAFANNGATRPAGRSARSAWCWPARPARAATSSLA